MFGVIRALSGLVAVVSLGGVIFGLVALIDPSGTQLANDSAPFAAPPTREYLLVQLVCWLVALLVGCAGVVGVKTK